MLSSEIATTGKPNSWVVKELSMGEVVPPNTPHGIAFHLPNWDKMLHLSDDLARKRPIKFGYPRFFIHEFFTKLNDVIKEKFNDTARTGCYAYPSMKAAEACKDYIQHRVPVNQWDETLVRLEELSLGDNIKLGVVLFSDMLVEYVYEFWSMCGLNTSTRLIKRCLNILQPDYITEINNKKLKDTDLKELKYAKTTDSFPQLVVVEYGNLHKGPQNDQYIKRMLRERISGYLEYPSPSDVYLFPTGMAAVSNSRNIMTMVMGRDKKSVCFGFPYMDTKEVLCKVGAGCHFFGNGDAQDIAKLECLLEKGEQIAYLHCEFPSNPLIKTVDLIRLKELSVKYNFPITVDNTFANFINVRGLDIADATVTSLSKIFSGYSDVMGGCLVLSSRSKYYNELTKAVSETYEDNLWWEDAIALEANSRNMVERVRQVNEDAEKLADYLYSHPLVKKVNYPKHHFTENYNRFKRSDGGYGGNISFELIDDSLVKPFFEAIPLVKGPSIGTNFTIIMPYTVVAHRDELDYVAQFGVPEHLLRISVGLEGFERLKLAFDDTFELITPKCLQN